MSKVFDFPAEKISRGMHAIYPEMGERSVKAELEADLIGKYYYVNSPVKLKPMRGIKFLYILSGTHAPLDERQTGWYSYQVTTKAMEKLKESYSIARKVLLD